MSPLASPPRPEELLAHTAWMKPLARRLLSDDAGADDIVQEAWLAALSRPPRAPEASGSWLGRVVRNLSLRARRERDRRERRERRAARPESLSVTPDQVLEQAEMHRLLVEEVLRMEEPYRSAVLLRYFGEQSAAQIALQQEVPLDTVKTRLRRALDRLRERLDRVYGGRQAWMLAILPLAGAAAAGTLAGGSAATAYAAGTGSACGASPAAAITGISLGGWIMGKTALAIGVVAVITLAGGYGIGRFLSKPDAEEAKARLGLVERTKVEEFDDRLQKAVAELEKAQVAMAALRGEKEALATRADALDGDLQAAREEAMAKAKAEERPKMAVSFGKYADLESLQTADWAEMADAAKNIGELFAQVMEKVAGGEKVGDALQALQLKIAEQNMKLVKPYLGLVGKIPTNAPGSNGEFTHPILTANLLGAVLKNAEVPLTSAQRKAFSQIGTDFESRYEQLQAGYGEGTPKLERFMDELELKREAMSGMRDLLRPEQRAAAYRSDVEDTMGDVLSAMVMAYPRIQGLEGDSAEGLRAALAKQVSEKYKLAPAQAEALGGAFDAWLDEVRPHLAPAKKGDLPRLDPTTAAGRAQVNLYKRILALADLDEKARQRVLGGESLLVPKLVEPGAESAKE